MTSIALAPLLTHSPTRQTCSKGGRNWRQPLIRDAASWSY